MPVKKPKPSTRKKTGGINLAPLISAVLLAAVKIASEDREDSRKKKGERTTKSRTRTQTRTK